MSHSKVKLIRLELLNDLGKYGKCFYDEKTFNFITPVNFIDEYTRSVTFETYRLKVSYFCKFIVIVINSCKNLEEIVFVKDTQTGLLLNDPPIIGWDDYIQDSRERFPDFSDIETKEHSKQIKDSFMLKIKKIVIKRLLPFTDCDMKFFTNFLLPFLYIKIEILDLSEFISAKQQWELLECLQG